jgi:hypothetical protein
MYNLAANLFSQVFQVKKVGHKLNHSDSSSNFYNSDLEDGEGANNGLPPALAENTLK